MVLKVRFVHGWRTARNNGAAQAILRGGFVVSDKPKRGVVWSGSVIGDDVKQPSPIRYPDVDGSPPQISLAIGLYKEINPNRDAFQSDKGRKRQGEKID